MPWGNYLKTPCEQCGTSYWALAGSSSSGSRNLCRSCGRIPSSAGSSVVTAAAAGSVAGRTSVRNQMQAQRFQAFQRVPARQNQVRRATTRAQTSETVESAVQSRLRELQFRELTPRDYEVLRQLDEAHSRRHVTQGLSASSGAQPWSNGQWRQQRTAMRPTALLPAPESDGWKGEDCAICLDGLTDRATVCALPRCGHIFHRTCIESWLTRGKPECPLDAIEVDC